MIAAKPTVVFDPYQWLPSFGESRVEIATNNLSLEIKIFYDSQSQEGVEVCRVLSFHGLVAFLVAAVPGVDLMKCTYEGVNALGSVVEFERSEAAQLWQGHMSWRDKRIRHFQVFFLADNKRVEVFAEEVRLGGVLQ